ncbi:MAG: tRNA 4-thiouridine(8) synthase ThiI [Clostridia bacterium]|nr:tRNA 4-thiouridine(8) synthase ThiI [Clostridia bacterium]
MKEVLLIKNGELALKGMNRRTFEEMLIKNMRRRLESLGGFSFSTAQSTITAEPLQPDCDLDEAVERLKKVFGIAGFSRAAAVEKEMPAILRAAETYLEPELLAARTFKAEAKRSDKLFPLKSPEICAEVGGYLLRKYPHLTVDVHDPDLTVTVEVRDQYAFIHGKQIKGAGGMPTASAGRAALLISGGIDSPVAGYMMAKRGLELVAVHFASPPYTSERAEQKVCALLKQVAKYSGRIALYIVPFTEIQEQIKDHCPEEIFTVIMRRMMMRIAQTLAEKERCGALITGESVGQVASQTVPALACTDAVCTMPVFRPLIGMDKDEVVAISRRIETFELSILPYEDCCTVFTPRHPRTRPTLDYVARCEQALEIDALARRAIETVRFMQIKAY